MHQRNDPSHAWRSEPGSYLLLLHLAAAASVEIGRLGCQTLQPGYYAYLGSALGPGGVAARLNRHLGIDKRQPGWRPHWHIDYLRPSVRIAGAGAVYGPDRLECTWSHALQALSGTAAPVKGFGSSDCRSGCAAHFWRLPGADSLRWIEDELTRCPIQMI